MKPDTPVNAHRAGPPRRPGLPVPLLGAAQAAVVAMLGVLHRQACLSCLTFFAAAGANDWLPDWLPGGEHSS